MRSTFLLSIVLIATTATAQFALPVTLALSDGAYAGAMVLLDVDSDGLEDVVVSWPYWADGYTAKWYKNLGSGFGTGQVLATQFGGEFRLLKADMDGDGDEDLLPSPYDWNVPCFGWFENTATTPWPIHLVDPLAYGTTELSYTLGDLDEDGDSDVVVVREPVHDLGWYANDGTGGFGPFTLIDPFIAGETERTELTLLDRDNDGDQDLCVVTDTIMLYANNGTGTFTTAYTAPVQLDQTGSMANLNWTVARDFDADGYTDLVIAENGLAPADRMLLYLHNENGAGFVIDTLIGTLNYYMIGLTAADVDQDGDQDLTVTRTSAPELSVLLNDPAEPTGFAPALTPLVQHGGGSKSILWGNLIGSSAPDVVVCDGPVSAVLLLEQSSPLQFIPHLVSTSVDSPKKIRAADMDNDGLLDLVVLATTDLSDEDGQVSWFKGDGSGIFDRQRMTSPDWASILPGDMDTGDLDGDGDTDVAVATTYGVSTMLNMGDDLFASPIFLNGGGSDVAGVLVKDMDGDGDLDLVSGDHSNTAQVGLYRNDGTGQFSAMEVVATSANPGFGTMAVDDIDMDGDQDVLSTSVTSELVLSRNSGAGFFTAPELLASGVGGGVPGQPRRFDLGDADQDGDPDVVYSHFADETVNLLVNAGGSFTSTVVYTAPSIAGVEFAQLDADAEPELVVWTGGQHFHLVVLQREVGGTYVPQFGADLPQYASGYELFDMDGDGDDDLVYGAGNQGPDPLLWRENFFLQGARIHGTVFADQDGDGVHDPEDLGFLDFPVQCTPPLTLWLTNDTGAYVSYVDTGSYQVSLTYPGPYWELSTDSSIYHVELDAFDQEYTGAVFGLHPTQAISEINPSITLGSGVCGAPVPIWLSYLNAGTIIDSGLAVLEVDTMFTYQSAEPVADSTVGQMSYWSFGNLPWFAQSGMNVTVLNPPAYDLGQTLQLVFTVTTVDEQGNVLGVFADTLQQEVTCAIDPNSKQVSPVGYGVHHAVEITVPYLDYTVHFQNTGTDTATTVMIRDELSPALDVGSVQIIATSHELTSCYVGSDPVLMFTFEGIDLPDSAADPLGSQGFVRFRIRPVAGLPTGTTVNNTAGIYFDLNDPVITNTTHTTLVDCSQYSTSITSVGDGLLTCTAGDAYQWFLNEVAIPGATGQQLFAEEAGTYTVLVTNELGCAVLSDAYAVVGVPAPGATTRRFAVFPNPANGLVHVVSDRPFSADTQFEVVDQQGHLVMRVSNSVSSHRLLDLSGLTPGLYSIRAVAFGAVLGSGRILLCP